MNILQQLKDNETPFGLMSAKMQAKAWEIGPIAFDQYRWNRGWVPCHQFFNDNTIRLRADYEEQPEIVECEITEADGHLHFRYNGMTHSIHQACDHAGFLGFRFEDGKMYPIATVYQKKGGGPTYYSIDTGKINDYEVLHATAVLFRGPK